jgi:hypothetical protein
MDDAKANTARINALSGDVYGRCAAARNDPALVNGDPRRRLPDRWFGSSADCGERRVRIRHESRV